MRFMAVGVAAAAAAIVRLGCGCSEPSSALKPIEITLNPHQRSWSIGGEGAGPKSPTQDSLGFGGLAGTGARGEWPSGCAIWSEGREKIPQIRIHLQDAERNAVRVEVTFTGPAVPRLKTIVFPHVTKSEKFMLMMANRVSAYGGHQLQGENLILKWPDAGDGTVTFLAWPHVH